MQPIGLLMIEHRLIERMLAAMDIRREEFVTQKEVDVEAVDTFVDFMKTYTDLCHHGKEEGILFREMDRKPLSSEHRRIMNELIREHQWARENTERLSRLTARCTRTGSEEDFREITSLLKSLLDFYPKHIEKEDKHFFLPAMRYFSIQEKDAMVEESYVFEREILHNKYKHIVEQMEHNVKAYR